MKRTLPPSLFAITLLLITWLVSAPARAEPNQTPSADTKICLQCHAERKVAGSHQKIEGSPADCLTCHAPHSRAGAPFLATPKADRCTACHNEYSVRSLKDQKRRDGTAVHDPLLKGNCADCHLPHDLGAPARYKNGDKNASCSECHSRTMLFRNSQYQHQPFQSNYCADCHDPHLSRERPLLRMPVAQLCGSCHPGAQAQLELPVRHKPFGQGLCTDCHGPHGAENPDILKVSEGDLCTSCHFPKDAQKPVQHPPYRDGTCTQCHSPHASATSRLLKASSSTALCASCHNAVSEQLAHLSRHPVGERLECFNCHRPHASDYEKLLVARGNGLCVTCHPERVVDYDKIGHSTIGSTREQEKGACTACHLPHGSADQPLLKRPALSLCRDCHSPMSQQEHPMGNQVLDPRTGQPVSCATCHDPHGTKHARSLKLPGDALCLACHVK